MTQDSAYDKSLWFGILLNNALRICFNSESISISELTTFEALDFKTLIFKYFDYLDSISRQKA